MPMDIDLLFIMVNRAGHLLGWTTAEVIIADLVNDFKVPTWLAGFAVRLAQM